jgi:MFS family permease
LQTVDRLALPAFLRDLGAQPGAVRTLCVAAVAMGAAGLNPPVASPVLPNIQSIIRAQPQANALVLLIVLIAAGLLFIGGVLGDADGRRGILIGALGVLVGVNALGLIITNEPLFIASRLASGAAAYAVLPFAMALVATTYSGVVRATAIGIVYAVYAGGTAVSPILLTILGPDGPRWPGFVVGSGVAALALWLAWSRAPNLPGAARGDRSYVVATAVWAFAIVMITSAVVDLGDRLADALQIGLLLAGLVMLAGYAVWARRTSVHGTTSHRVDRRPVTVAVAVGVIVSFAQAAPLFQLPVFFNLVLGYGAFLATIAIAPFVLALIVAGPVAGAVLSRIGPRTLVAAGLAAVGLGNVIAALVIGQEVVYVAIAVPLVLIGAGFVVATTVRTAIIFASVPRGLPASAAAINEASVLVGSRIGFAALTAVITQRALDIYAGSLLGVDSAQRDSAVGAFRDVLVAIGTPGIHTLAGSLSQVDVEAYKSAFVEAYRQGLLGTGLIAMIAAPIAWFALGARDPLTTMWDHRDERTGGETSAS